MSKQIGIPGIPAILDSLMDGAIYSAFIESVPARLSVLIQSLKANLAQGTCCVLLTPTPPGVFLARAQSSGVDFTDDLLHDRLFLFSPAGDYAKNIFRLGSKRFMEDFNFFPIPAGSFFLFDQASDLFTLHDQAVSQQQVQEYRDWIKQKESSALFLFSVPEDEKTERQHQVLQDYFTGEFRIIQNKGSLELLIDFWYSQQGTVAAKFIPVFFDESGLLKAKDHVEVEPLKVAHDQNTGFYYGPDFDTFAASVPERIHWNKAESLVSLMHLTRNSVACAIVIALDRHSELRQVAETVHYLRLNRGNQIKILIRACNFFLRAPAELMLMRLGASLVIHPNTAPHRLPLLWESLVGHIYTRELEQDFEQAFNSITPSERKGYVDLATFLAETRQVLERIDHLAIPPALVIAAYAPGANPQSSLSKFNISRIGDLLTSTDSHCYLFLHSCPEGHVATAFARIIEGNANELFPEIGFITDTAEIGSILSQLSQNGNAIHDLKVERQPAIQSFLAEEQKCFHFGPGFNSFVSLLPNKSAWRNAPSLAALVKSCSGIPDATIVIALDSSADLRQSAETVHGLRQSLGNAAKIMVREHEFTLRRPYELLLLKLGANLVLHRQATQAELRLSWDELQKQIFAGEPVADFNQTFNSIAPSRHMGFIDLPLFCQEVRQVMERVDEAIIPPALIVASYKKPVHPPEILSKIRIWRMGDMLSSDRDQCYLFLHSCPENDLSLAFSRIIEEKPENLFSAIGYISEKEKIRDLVSRISDAKKAAIIPDYGKMLQDIARTEKKVQQAAQQEKTAAGVQGLFGRLADAGEQTANRKMEKP